MTKYARIQSGVVAEPLFTPPAGMTIADCFHAALTWVDVTNVEPEPQSGWAATETSGVWVFTAPPARAAPTLAQQAAALIAGGLAITSAGTPSLSATYPTDPATQQKLLGVQSVLSATSAFPGGAETWPVKDSSGNWHVFTAAQFAAIAIAIATFVAPCDLIMDGHTGVSLPVATATIT